MTVSLDIATRIADRHRGRGVIPAGVEDYAQEYIEFLAHEGALDRNHGYVTWGELLVARDTGRELWSSPAFFVWMRANNRGPFAPVTTPTAAGQGVPVFDADMSVETLAANRVALLAPVADLVRAHYRRSGTDRDFVDLVLTDEVTRRSDGRRMPEIWVRYARGETGSYLVNLLAYLRDHRSEIPMTTATPATAAPALPTSPRDAFPTEEAMLEAARRWERDTDPRLPNERSTAGEGHIYNRDHQGTSATRVQDGSFSYATEMLRAWRDNDFHANPGSYSDGFWRDVRTLGYGTPAWNLAADRGEKAMAQAGIAGAPMPIGPEHPGWDAWWTTLRRHAERDGYMRQFRTLAAAMGYAEPTNYSVALRVSVPRTMNTAEMLTYLREHPEAMQTATIDSIYAA